MGALKREREREREGEFKLRNIKLRNKKAKYMLSVCKRERERFYRGVDCGH
jgi:hypothetical protein